MLKTLSEIRSNIGSTARETQINALIDSFINWTLADIWSYHTWTFKRRKTTFATVASQEDYNLDESIDEIALIRQLTTPRKLIYVPDREFYRYLPDPENASTGVPKFYRRWAETGFQTNTSQDEAITVESSSTADGSSFKVVVVGEESTNQLVVKESLTLNGTTAVTSTNTWESGRLISVAKSATTTGTITVKGATSGTTLTTIAPEETAPRFKRIGLYPIPSSAITMYVEYYERLRLLTDDNDVIPIDTKWAPVLREGVLAKVYEYKQKEQLFLSHQQLYTAGLDRMRREDDRNVDYVPTMGRRYPPQRPGVIELSDNAYSLIF